MEQLQSLQQKLNRLHGDLLAELKALDGRWLKAAAEREAQRDIWPELEQLYRLFGYFNRWSKQIQERLVQLTF